jgi:CDP-diacylglycerol--serine O-phosphatidyltransferase
MGFIWVLNSYGVPGREISLFALLITIAAGGLMVSNIRFRSFKDLNLRERVPFMTILAVPLAFVLVFLDPPQVLFAVFLGYALSGPIAWLLRQLRRRPAAERPAEKGRGL